MRSRRSSGVAARRLPQCLAIAIAAAAALVPWPAALVEEHYAGRLYPALQARLTSWSNQSPVALLDPLVAVLALAVLGIWWRSVVGARRRRSLQPVAGGLLATLTLGSVMYLWFLLAWGLQYSRVPLEDALPVDRSRVTADAVLALAERGVDEANRAHGGAHKAGFPAPGEMPPALVRALHEVEHRLGRARPTVPSRPKRTLLGPFFRAAGIDGLHAPFLLETLLNPDLTPPERPAVLAHEWAHLSGYAPEHEASAVGLLAALRADAPARYSAWLTIVFDTARQLPPTEQSRVLVRLGPGPRADQEAVRARLRTRVEVVQRASWDAYDRYLRAHGVTEGIQSYTRVVELLIGSGALEWQ